MLQHVSRDSTEKKEQEREQEHMYIYVCVCVCVLTCKTKRENRKGFGWPVFQRELIAERMRGEKRAVLRAVVFV